MEGRLRLALRSLEGSVVIKKNRRMKKNEELE